MVRDSEFLWLLKKRVLNFYTWSHLGKEIGTKRRTRLSLKENGSLLIMD